MCTRWHADVAAAPASTVWRRLACSALQPTCCRFPSTGDKCQPQAKAGSARSVAPSQDTCKIPSVPSRRGSQSLKSRVTELVSRLPGQPPTTQANPAALSSKVRKRSFELLAARRCSPCSQEGSAPLRPLPAQPHGTQPGSGTPLGSVPLQQHHHCSHIVHCALHQRQLHQGLGRHGGQPAVQRRRL